MDPLWLAYEGTVENIDWRARLARIMHRSRPPFVLGFVVLGGRTRTCSVTSPGFRAVVAH